MFKYVKSIGGVGRKLQKVLLDSSTTFKIGEVVETYSTGVAKHADAAKPVLGVITDFCDARGLALRPAQVTPDVASGNSNPEVTTGAANTTIYAFVDISKDTVYAADVTGTIGTTVDSELPGARIDIDSAGTEYGKVKETTATRTIATTANFYSFGKSESGKELLVKIANSEMESDASTEA